MSWQTMSRMGGLTIRLAQMQERGGDLERALAESKLQTAEARLEATEAELRAVAAEKGRQGANLTRPEAAAYLGVSTKTIQRMEADGQLRRCPGRGGVVRYAARDVLRIASAKGRGV